MVAAFAIAPPAQDPGVELTTVIQKLPAPSITLLEAGKPTFLREERVRRSDTIASLMSRLGIYDGEALQFIRSNQQARDMARHLQAGTTVSAETGAWGNLHSLSVDLPGGDAMLVIERNGDDFVAREQPLQLESRTVIKSGEIRHSLFAATDDADIPDAIAMQMVEIFGGELDFHRDLRKGDRFSLVYESFTDRGQPVRSGRILAAELVNDQTVLQAYWFQPEQGEGAYHTSDGSSLRKAFLRSPIEFSRISSGFSGARFHPILRTWRAHKGVDYAARAGTGVVAVADGVVETAAHRTGYGKLLVIKHQGSYSTAYGHLQASPREFAKERGCGRATPSATLAKPAWRPAPICTTNSGSRKNRSTRWPLPCRLPFHSARPISPASRQPSRNYASNWRWPEK
ncbi:M23 family metallopeptidase [Candidatus Accumulibacter phosphatis]|uniref:M23 family metallopeptidase n=1 Tax=Candidatus Accumulibacter phosphatis TaxID=327160 RepID=A0ABX1TWQ8_9PROT|nr:M23 family metallopeptidase [Candidatus Accumulibacter phosphatis]NMQ27108.1 M23 family metallopeptidase [Candidatus Accumulibacter phosphatis]